jgi:hypothetical protein
MTVRPPLLKRSLLSRRLAMCTLMGSLAACSPTESARPELTAETGPVATSPQALTVSPEIPLPTELYIAGQNLPAVAAANGIYLVVRKELVNSVPGIRAVRVRASDGAVLDSTPITLEIHSYQDPSALTDPWVTSDGTNFLVIYSSFNLGSRNAYNDIRGIRVRASDGAVLGTSSFSFSSTRDSFRPTVAFDGQNYLGVWEGWSVPRGGLPSEFALYGLRMRTSGQSVEDRAFAIAPNGYNPKLAYGGGSYLLAWSEGSDWGPVRVTAISPQGAGAPMPSLTLAANGHKPALAFDGTNFLVAWMGADGVLKARRVSASPLRVLDTADLTVGTGATSAATVTADSSSFRVTYVGTRGSASQIVSTRIQGTGEVGPEQVLSDMRITGGGDRVAVASLGPDQNLVAYTDFNPSMNRTTIHARRFSDPQAAPCTTPGAPILTVNGGTELTLECGSGTYTDQGAQAVDGCGNAVQVHAYNTGGNATGPGPNLGAEGTYSVSYAAWNTSGDVSVTRTVHVDDRTAPVLALKGAAHQTHTCGSQWVDPGVEATDACYGNLAGSVWRTGEVNGWAKGTYTVTYSLTDSGGNTATPVTRTVEVVNCPW